MEVRICPFYSFSNSGASSLLSHGVDRSVECGTFRPTGSFGKKASRSMYIRSACIRVVFNILITPVVSNHFDALIWSSQKPLSPESSHIAVEANSILTAFLLAMQECAQFDLEISVGLINRSLHAFFHLENRLKNLTVAMSARNSFCICGAHGAVGPGA